MKKLTALLLTLAIAALLFAACENVTYPDESSSSSRPGESDPYENNSLLPPPIEIDDNNERHVCRIVTDDETVFYQSEEAPTIISSSLEERNAFLEQNYNIAVSVVESSYAEILENIRAALSTQDNYCDLIAISQKNSVKLYLAGVLYDINGLAPYGFDLDNGLFDEYNAKALATNSTLYMLPDPSALVYDGTNVVFFNRDHIDSSLTDPETLVQQGKWTWDRFTEHAKSAASLSNGRYGFSTYYENDEFAYPFWASAGTHIVDNTYKNEVALTATVTHMTDVVESLVKHYNVSYIYSKQGADATSLFEQGNSVFLFNKLGYLYALRDGSEKGSNFGFLPMPKLDESQERYECLVSQDARVLSMPATLKFKSESDLRSTYALLATTCGVGGKTLKSAYVKATLTSYLTTNAETLTLQTITDSVTFDFVWAYAPQIKEIAGATLRAVGDRIEYGSKLDTTVSRGKSAFNNYVNAHYN